MSATSGNVVNAGATPPRSLASIWFQALRAYSFTASVIPLTLGAAIALNDAKNGKPVTWAYFPIVLIAGVLFHAGTNLMNDYVDFKKGVDRIDTLGSSGVLTHNLLTPRAVFIGAWTCFLVGIALGLVLVADRGLPMLYLGIAGFLGGYFYSGEPFGYKYVGLGDILVFLMMGTLMVVGSHVALTGEFTATPVLLSIPIGCLVTAILHANNLRDIDSDKTAHITTLAVAIGAHASKLYFHALVITAYLSVVAFVALGITEFPTLAVFLSLPPAIGLMNAIHAVEPAIAATGVGVVERTAQFHFLFGLLLTLAVGASAFV